MSFFPCEERYLPAIRREHGSLLGTTQIGQSRESGVRERTVPGIALLAYEPDQRARDQHCRARDEERPAAPTDDAFCALGRRLLRHWRLSLVRGNRLCLEPPLAALPPGIELGAKGRH
jgi:hypothetical protein